MLALTISMLMTAGCMFPLHQESLLWHWMVYSHVWPLSIHGCRQNWNWTQIKLNSSLLGTKDSGVYSSPSFILSFSVSKLTQQKSARNLGVIFDGHFTFHSPISAVCSSYFYQMQNLRRPWLVCLSNVHVLTMWCVFGVFSVLFPIDWRLNKIGKPGLHSGSMASKDPTLTNLVSYPSNNNEMRTSWHFSLYVVF